MMIVFRRGFAVSPPSPVKRWIMSCTVAALEPLLVTPRNSNGSWVVRLSLTLDATTLPPATRAMSKSVVTPFHGCAHCSAMRSECPPGIVSA